MSQKNGSYWHVSYEVPYSSSQVVVPRRLSEAMRGCLSKPLTLIVGAGGSGKTTLVSTFTAPRRGKPGWSVAWVCVGSLEDAYRRFWGFLLQSFDDEAFTRPFVEALDSALNSGAPENVGLWIDGFLQAVAESRRQFIVVVDDAHCLKDKLVLRDLGRIILEAPENLHFIVMGRFTPKIPLFKLRMHERVNDIRESDLLFTPVEAREFFAARGAGTLRDEELGGICDLTHGWVTGLNMVSVLLKSGRDATSVVESLPRDDQTVAYLTEKMLDEMDPAVEEFVLKTSFLPVVSAEVCKRILPQVNCTEALRSLVSMNLLLPSASAEPGSDSYSYHPLFASALRQFRETEYSSEEIAAAYAAATSFFEEKGEYEFALKVAFEVGDYESGLRIITERLYVVLARVESGVLLRWLKDLPHPEDGDDYLYCVVNAWANFVAGKTKRSRMWLEDARARCAEAGESDKGVPKGVDRIVGTIEVANLVFAGENEKALELGGALLESLGGPQLFLRSTVMHNMGEALERLGRYDEAYEHFIRARIDAELSERRTVSLLCSYELGWLQFIQGNLENASSIFLKTIAGCARGERNWGIGLAHVGMAFLYNRWGDFDRSRASLDRAFSYLDRLTNKDGYWEGRVVLAELQIAEGLYDEACESMFEAYEALSADFVPRGVGMMVSMALSTALSYVGNRERALDILEKTDAHVSERDSYTKNSILLRRALMTFRCGDAETAAELFRRTVANAEEAGLSLVAQDAKAGYACALRQLGRDAEARGMMMEALREAHPEMQMLSFLRPLKEEGVLLAEIASGRGDNKVYAEGNLDIQRFAEEIMERRRGMFGESCGWDAAASDENTAAQVLSEREQEIYALLKQGKTRREIADALGIRVNTVRTHVRNIYTKTGVHDRNLL